MSATNSIRRRQIDRALSATGVRTLAIPGGGWVRTIRNAIGMRVDQLSARTSISQPAITQFERAEAEGTISLNSLAKLAAALDCRLVYAFVPRTSFDTMVRERAQLIAQKAVGAVAHSMALEDQSLLADAQLAMIDDLANDLIQKLPRELWDEPA